MNRIGYHLAQTGRIILINIIFVKKCISEILKKKYINRLEHHLIQTGRIIPINIMSKS